MWLFTKEIYTIQNLLKIMLEAIMDYLNISQEVTYKLLRSAGT
jgi:hypothetical protein